MWKKVKIVGKLYSCDQPHLSHSTASCDSVRFVIKFNLFCIYAFAIVNNYSRGGSE